MTTYIRSDSPPARAAPAFAVLATTLATFLAASTVPTPLYASYAASWHLSPSAVTVAFGVYALALLGALLTFGSVSDAIGRRPVILCAVALQIVGAAVLFSAGGYGLLLAGRVIQGLATGMGVGALSAAVLTAEPRRGAVANAAAPLTGSALGGLLAALLIELLPGSPRDAYAVLLVLLAVEAVAIWGVLEPSAHRARVLPRLRPTIALPRVARAGFAAAAPVIFAVYALSGLFASLGPSLVRSLCHSASVLLGVLPLVLMNLAAPAASITTRSRPARHVLMLGVAGALSGVAIAIAAVVSGSIALLWLSAIVSGVGFGAGFRGGQQVTLANVAEDQRAGVISAIYIVSYIGFGVPAIIAGILDSATGDLELVALGYCAVLVLLAAVSGLLLQRTPTATRRTT